MGTDKRLGDVCTPFLLVFATEEGGTLFLGLTSSFFSATCIFSEGLSKDFSYRPMSTPSEKATSMTNTDTQIPIMSCPEVNSAASLSGLRRLFFVF